MLVSFCERHELELHNKRREEREGRERATPLVAAGAKISRRWTYSSGSDVPRARKDGNGGGVSMALWSRSNGCEGRMAGELSPRLVVRRVRVWELALLTLSCESSSRSSRSSSSSTDGSANE